jgi:hypothetical protein
MAASSANEEKSDRKTKRSRVSDIDQVKTELRIILNSCLYIFMGSPYS